MKIPGWRLAYGVSCITVSLSIASCSSYTRQETTTQNTPSSNYASRLPSTISTNEKVVVVDPHAHVWGAYDSSGNLVKAGLASAGANYCPDLGRACRTGVGSFRINSLGSPDCKSSLFPIGKGGAPMPYCMFFHNNQALHGVPDSEVVEGNVSHGCVRLHVSDAEWLRYNFVDVGTKVIIKPYG